MIRERALQIALVIIGLLFVAAIIGMMMVRGQEDLQMMLSLYVTLGVFLLIAARNPSAHRSLIAFTIWSSFAHAGVMCVQSLYDLAERRHLLVGSTLFITVGAVLLALTIAPSARPVEARQVD
jgi:predicted anti-sigma-YlaC factor YlaD